MDKIYPRFLIRKRRCRCGAPPCKQRVWLAFVLTSEDDRDQDYNLPVVEHSDLFVVQDKIQEFLDAGYVYKN